MNIQTYVTEKGLSPFEEFISSLAKKEKAKLIRDIDLLKDLAPNIGEPYVKKLKGYNNLYEVRTKHGTKAIRVFYFYFDGDAIVLLTGFLKKSNKTPKNHIEKAVSYKDDFLRRITE